jgi:hypothetical protein
MPITHKRLSAHTLLAASAILVGALLTGCSDDDSKDNASSSSSASPKSGFDQALAHAKCMRENGVPNYPDPKEDGNGRVQIVPGEGVDPNDPNFQKAMDACRDLMPQGQQARGGGEIDSSKVAEWAKCMRENGVPKMEDPKIEGGQLIVDAQAAGVSPGDPAFNEAQQACMDKNPGGSLMLRRGGGE